MTATNKCYNFVGFGYRAPLICIYSVDLQVVLRLQQQQNKQTKQLIHVIIALLLKPL